MPIGPKVAGMLKGDWEPGLLDLKMKDSLEEMLL